MTLVLLFLDVRFCIQHVPFFSPSYWDPNRHFFGILCAFSSFQCIYSVVPQTVKKRYFFCISLASLAPYLQLMGHCVSALCEIYSQLFYLAVSPTYTRTRARITRENCDFVIRVINGARRSERSCSFVSLNIFQNLRYTYKTRLCDKKNSNFIHIN